MATCMNRPNNIRISNDDNVDCNSYLNVINTTNSATNGSHSNNNILNGTIGNNTNSSNMQLDFVLLNANVLLKDLEDVMAIVKELYDSYIQWFYKLEYQFFIRVETGEIPLDLRLFNRIPSVVQKMKRANKLTRTWYAIFLNECNDLSDYLLQYQKFEVQLKSIDVTTYAGGTGIMQPNKVTLAKANLSRSKSIQRLRTRIMTLDTKIRTSMQEISFLMRDLKSGRLRINQDGNRTTYDFKEITDALAELGQNNSPLTQIYERLATIINQTPMVSTLRTEPVTRLSMTNPRQFLNEIQSTELSTNDLLKRLNELIDRKLYTTSSQESIEAIESYVEENFKTSAQYAQIQNAIKTLRNNTPTQVITELRAKANDKDNIWHTIQRIKSFIANLSENDAIFRNSFEDILETANKTATRVLNDENVNRPMVNRTVNPLNEDLLNMPEAMSIDGDDDDDDTIANNNTSNTNENRNNDIVNDNTTTTNNNDNDENDDVDIENTMDTATNITATVDLDTPTNSIDSTNTLMRHTYPSTLSQSLTEAASTSYGSLSSSQRNASSSNTNNIQKSARNKRVTKSKGVQPNDRDEQEMFETDGDYIYDDV